MSIDGFSWEWRFEADSITGLSNGDLIGTWPDSSGNSRDATQATSGNRPVWVAAAFGGVGGLQFPTVGSARVLKTAAISALSQPSTIFIVSTGLSTANTVLIDGLSSGNRHLVAKSAGNLSYVFAGSTAVTTNADFADAGVLALRVDGSSTQVLLNGESDEALAAGSEGLTGLAIGNAGPTLVAAGNQVIGAVLVVNESLSDAEMDTVGNYLATKFGYTWTNLAEPGPSGSGTLTATTNGTATLAVGSFSGFASLTVTSGGTAIIGGPVYAAATLTATTGGSADLDGGLTIDPAAHLAVTTDGSATLGVGSDVYAAIGLTVTTGGSATLGVTAAAAAMLSVGTSGSAWLARTWTPDPVTGRGAYTLTVTDRAGAPFASLDSAYITRAIVDRLNDVDGTGSGTAFTVPDEATDAHANLRQYRELQVARGGHHLGTYVLLNPDDTGTASAVSWQAAGLGHYFTKRRIGPAVRPGLLPKAWRAGFREGSIPPAPPKWSRPDTPALVGPALRVEGSTYVQRTVTRLGADTTFAFGSYVLTATGKDALRAFADEIVVDTNLNDLIDIEPPTVTIEGHTDNIPYTSHPGGNQWLSEQRANAVRDFLAPLVPEGTTLNAVGYGASRPIASNATSAGRQANRRVDLTYPKTVSARGHRQYLQDSLFYTNPSAHIKRVLTFVSWWSLESYKEPNADGSVIWLGRRPVGSTDDDAWTEADWVDIDDETPLNTWTRSEVSITVPADGQAWEIVARLTPPAGTIVYDEGATELWADDALEFIDVDQALIVKGLVEHAQDPAFDKDDLGIATDTPLTGVKRTRVYYWHERATISDCLEELVNVSGGMDLTWQTTPTTRTLVSHYPRAGQVTSASLQTGEQRTVDDYQISLNGAAAATTVIVQADGSGADREEGVTQGVPDDLDLVLEDVWTAEPGTHIGELNNQAQRGHRNYGGQVPIVTATVRQEHTDEWLDRVHLGDVITVDLPARVRHVTGPHRVTARSLDPITDRLIVSPTVEV